MGILLTIRWYLCRGVMGISFSVALSSIILGGGLLAGSYAVSVYDISPWAEKSFHPMLSIGDWVQKQLYPFEMRRTDFTKTARAQEIADPATMPRPATPCDTVWRTPYGEFLFSSVTYDSGGSTNISPSDKSGNYRDNKTTLTPGAAHGPDDGRVTPVIGISPQIYQGKNRVSMIQYIQRRVFGDKPITDDGKNYNSLVFRSGSPWQRAHSDFQGYYAFQIGDNLVPFLPPAVQKIPVREGNGQSQWDGFPAVSYESIQQQVNLLRSKNAWHWVNIMQWPAKYRAFGGLGPYRVSSLGAYNQLEKDVIELGMAAYDFINRGRPQEAATLEWYPIGKNYSATDVVSGFQMVNLASNYSQYVPLEEWTADALRTYILTQLNWNPGQLQFIDLSKQQVLKKQQKRIERFGII